MLDNKEFQAWITCEGRTLREFHTAVDGKEVSCWIPCEVGKRFAVHWTDRGTTIPSAGYLTFDGQTAPGRFLYGSGTTHRDTIRIDKDYEVPVLFAEVNASRKQAESRSSGVGTIVLKIRQVKLVEPTHNSNPACEVPNSVVTLGTGGVCIGFGRPELSTRQHEKTWGFEPYDWKNPSHYVRFVWRYGTEDFLRGQRIMIPGDTMYVDEGLACIAHLRDEQSEAEAEAPLASIQAQQYTQPYYPHSLLSTALVSPPSGTMVHGNSTELPYTLHLPYFGHSDSALSGYSNLPETSGTRRYYRPHVNDYSLSIDGYRLNSEQSKPSR